MKSVEISETGKMKDRYFLHFLHEDVDYIMHAQLLMEETPSAKIWINGRRIKKNLKYIEEKNKKNS